MLLSFYVLKYSTIFPTCQGLKGEIKVFLHFYYIFKACGDIFVRFYGSNYKNTPLRAHSKGR